MGLRLGTTNGVFNVASGKTLKLEEDIDEAGPGSGFAVAGGGTLVLSGNNSALAGGEAQVGGTLRLLGAANALGGADGPLVVMNGGALAIGNSFSLPNDILIPAGAGTVNIQSSSSVSANYAGTVTASHNVQFFQTQSGGNVTVSGTNNSIATNGVVSFRCNGSGGDLTDNAIWSGEGSIVYATTSGGGGDTSISGQKTHSGGSTINATFTNAQCVINASSIGPAGAPTSGPFGTGGLTLGGSGTARLRAGTGSDITIGNPVTILSGGVVFTTVASEKSLTFTGPATMVGGNRQLTVVLGQNDPTKSVEFSGGIGDDGSGRNLTKGNSGTLILSGTNTYTGDTIVNGGTLDLAAAGQLQFVIGTNGANNQINGNGTGINNLDGSFNLDLTGADTTLGNSWTLVDTNSVTATFGATFSVKSTSGDFFEAANVWTLDVGGGNALSFSEDSGVLSVVSSGPSGPATLTNSVSGGALNLSWPDEGWILEWQTNLLSAPWLPLTDGSVSSTNIPIDITQPAVFYRLSFP
jgi:autotransporter-associated beta strand protein